MYHWYHAGSEDKGDTGKLDAPSGLRENSLLASRDGKPIFETTAGWSLSLLSVISFCSVSLAKMLLIEKDFPFCKELAEVEFLSSLAIFEDFFFLVCFVLLKVFLFVRLFTQVSGFFKFNRLSTISEYRFLSPLSKQNICQISAILDQFLI